MIYTWYVVGSSHPECWLLLGLYRTSLEFRIQESVLNRMKSEQSEGSC